MAPRRPLTLAAALLVLGALVAPAVAQTPAPTVVRVGLALNDDVTPLLYAQRAGIFAREGLDVRVTPSSSGTAMSAAVVAGSMDFGKASLTAVINAHTRNVPLVLVAPCGIYDVKDPYAELVVAADSPVKSGKDLDGKTIGVPSLNDLNELATMAWVDAHGGDAKSLHVLEVPSSATEASLVSHRIDAAIMTEPALARAVANKKVRILADAYEAIGQHYLFSAYYATKDWAAKHPEIVQKFRRGLFAAAAYTNTHHAETAPLLSEATKIPVDVILKMRRSVAPTTLEPSQIQPMIDAAATYKFIPKPFPAREIIAAGS